MLLEIFISLSHHYYYVWVLDANFNIRAHFITQYCTLSIRFYCFHDLFFSLHVEIYVGWPAQKLSIRGSVRIVWKSGFSRNIFTLTQENISFLSDYM